MKDIKIFETGYLSFSFAWYDLWVGVFIDSAKKKIYVCPLPALLFTIKFN